MYAMKEKGHTMLEGRVAKIESDVSFLRSDVLELKADQREIRHDLKALANDFSAFRVEVSNRFGTVETSIESLKRWVIVSGLSAMATLLCLLGTLVAIGHSLKWF